MTPSTEAIAAARQINLILGKAVERNTGIKQGYFHGVSVSNCADSIQAAIKEATEELEKSRDIWRDMAHGRNSRAAQPQKSTGSYSLEEAEQLRQRWQKDYGPVPRPSDGGCKLCEVGFPINEHGDHIPTQRLGMIPVTPCKKAAQPQEPLDAAALVEARCKVFDRIEPRPSDGGLLQEWDHQDVEHFYKQGGYTHIADLHNASLATERDKRADWNVVIEDLEKALAAEREKTAEAEAALEIIRDKLPHFDIAIMIEGRDVWLHDFIDTVLAKIKDK